MLKVVTSIMHTELSMMTKVTNKMIILYFDFHIAEKKRLAARQRDEAWEGTLGEN
jgi:hypothetical protein